MSQLPVKKMNYKSDVLILGSGIGGLCTALKLAEECQVTLVSKGRLIDGATVYAQGGIAAVWSENDSFEDHIQDTLEAGAGLCDRAIVEMCVKEGPARVEELIKMGVPFTKSNTGKQPVDPTEVFDLHQEGGHRKRRILHVKDHTGRATIKTLLDEVVRHKNINVLTHHVGIDLIQMGQGKNRTCIGAYLLDSVAGNVHPFLARAVVIATGGAGKAYIYTSNPDSSTGDGVAMAYRAGAKIANMEFIQFHPTCLYHPDAKNFLVTEALRGEGAELRLLSGEAFMARHHPMGSLAPRDIVARAIDIEMKRTGDPHVLLDTTVLGGDLEDRFPHIAKKAKQYGIDINTQAIPVVPAAHYTCGGVLVDEWGNTTLNGLYAVGEVACTSLHGANRLASNSLLEGVVYADRVARSLHTYLKEHLDWERIPNSDFRWKTGHAVEIEEQIDIASLWREIRFLMWNYVGIVRSNRRLEKAKRRLDLISEEVNEYYWDYLPTKDLIELRNLTCVAKLIVTSALLRKESRGLHFNVDYSYLDDEFYLKNTIL